MSGDYRLFSGVSKVNGIWLSAAELDRLLYACLPSLSAAQDVLTRELMTEARCEECGGVKSTNCSPEYIEHTSSCPGVSRYMFVRRMIEEAAASKSIRRRIQKWFGGVKK